MNKKQFTFLLILLVLLNLLTIFVGEKAFKATSDNSLLVCGAGFLATLSAVLDLLFLGFIGITIYEDLGK